MRTPQTRIGRLALGTAAALLTAGAVAAPAAASEGVSDDKQSKGNHQLSVSPTSGPAGTTVTVRATCEPAGGAASEALRQPIHLKRNDNNQWVGTGQIKREGLRTGQSYPIRVTCVNGNQQTGSFTVTATPSGGASAGFGGSQDGGGYATALAVGGGIAVAGAVGYAFTARRRAAGNHYY
ncbi:hypothetical protein [Streptomyces bohaiensis]|uniref:Secreted protein n=1 Tax=Streptomyces bohaiensis TaxID=1431344 RepID=A0ABX1CI07_9ACTN|nr:hypothetical protein [Streptomyces bohaiensis]NJQ17082.1 hypothetical protein [Streptomyces bohaiensis]